MPPGRFGEEIDDPVLFELPPPRTENGRTWGTVLFIDGFGNVITDIPGPMLEVPVGSPLEVTLGGKTFPCISASTYADADPGQHNLRLLPRSLPDFRGADRSLPAL